MRVISSSFPKGQTEDEMNWNEMEGTLVKGQWTPNLAGRWSHLKCWGKYPFPGTTLTPPEEHELALGLGNTVLVVSGGSWLTAFRGRHFSYKFFWIVNAIFYSSLIECVKLWIFAASTILRSVWVLRLWLLTSPQITANVVKGTHRLSYDFDFFSFLGNHLATQEFLQSKKIKSTNNFLM